MSVRRHQPGQPRRRRQRFLRVIRRLAAALTLVAVGISHARCGGVRANGGLVRGTVCRQRRHHRRHRFPRARRRRERALRSRAGEQRSRRPRQGGHRVGVDASIPWSRLSDRRKARDRCRGMWQHPSAQCVLVVLDRATWGSMVLQQHRGRQSHAPTGHGRRMVVRARANVDQHASARLRAATADRR